MGDKKEFNGETYHFCDTPTHRSRIKWHLHHPDDCRVRKIWMQKKEEKPKNDGFSSKHAHVGESSTPSDFTVDEQQNPSDKANEPPNLQALLASAMNLANENPLVRDHLAEALNAFHET